MHQDMSILSLITGASLVVQLIMLLLLLASVASWTIILKKRRQLALAQKQAHKFEQQFWQVDDLNQLYHQVSSQESPQGLSAIFMAGFKEYSRVAQDVKKKPKFSAAPDEAIARAMRVHTSREIDQLEAELTTLATIGSTAPYIGLFGTVWGIMNSFRGLGGVQQATLSMVAPGIAEALVATAMGLFAAIPAVIAYNGLSTKLGRLETRYETFAEELTQILLRHIHGDKA